MKKVKLIFPILLASFLLLCCEDDPKNGVENSVIDAISNGTWRITNVKQNHVDNTLSYDSFTFTFASGNAIFAIKDTITYYGGWTISDTDSDNDVLSDLRFNIEFADPAPPEFQSLTNAWTIPAYSLVKMDLAVINSIGGTDSLWFEQN